MRNSADPKPAVLVVDDDRATLRALSAALRNECRVIATATGAEAVGCLQRERPHLAFVDLVLGSESGVEIIASLKSAHPEIRIVLMTGYPEWQGAVAAMQAGACGVLAKPVELRELIACLQQNGPAPTPRASSRFPTIAAMKRAYVAQVVADCGGNLSEAARRLQTRPWSIKRMLGVSRKASSTD